MWLSPIIYSREVTVVDTGKNFYANITNDKSTIRDTYPQTIYDDEIP